MMSKDTIRKGMLTALFELGPVKRKKAELQLHKQLYHSTFWEKASVIGMTLSQDLEWDTRAIARRAWRDGKRVCVPKSIHQTRQLDFYEITHFDQVEVGYYDIEEPIPEKTQRINPLGIDLLIVPGVVFTREGYRIGFGGGYYDRFLKDFPNTTLSLVHSNQLMDHFPIEEHDLPVQYLVTEQEVVDCQKT